MSKLFITNPETGHPQYCGCDSCLKQVRLRLMAPNLFPQRLPQFDPGDLLDFKKLPWPDEIAEEKKKKK